MPLIVKSNEDDAKSPHLALCHEAQGFSANNRHVSLLMKSGVEITDEILKALDALGISELNKAAFYSQVRTMLQTAVKEKYGDDKEWLYVEDFNDSVVIFCNEKGVYSVDYSLVDGEATIGDLANPVTSVITYMPTTGNMLLSEDAEDKLEEGVYSLVTKALENETTKEHLVEMFKSLDNEVKLLEQEIQKAVEAAEAVLKAQLKDKETELQKALEKVAEFEKEKKEAKEKIRKALVAEVEKEEKEAEELYKNLEALSDEAFEAVIKTMKAKEEKLATSDMFVRKSKTVTKEEASEEDLTTKLLKSQFTKEGDK